MKLIAPSFMVVVRAKHMGYDLEGPLAAVLYWAQVQRMDQASIGIEVAAERPC